MNFPLLRGLLIAGTVLLNADVRADDMPMDQLLSLSLEDLMKLKVQVGSRTGDNLLGSHKIPVDIITADMLRRSGYNELPKVLNHLLASFTYDFSTLDDLTDHARPFSLNGLKADQVLVLINGKRVHQSAIIDVNDSQNRGSSGVDLNLIPIEIIDRVEVLRDDASAQYGSDAIAGVINIVLKHQVVSEAVVSSAVREAGDGQMLAGTINYGTQNTFFSLEYKHKEHSNTSGLDRRDYYFAGDLRNGDYRVTHRYGDPEMQSLSLTVNGEDIWDVKGLYTQGKIVYKESEATGFFRRPQDDRNLRAYYPDGFLPELAPSQQDIFSTLGYRTENDGIRVDVSNTFGYNHVAINVDNSVNTSLGLASPRAFDAGGLTFWQDSLNLDVTRVVHMASAPLNLAYGAELRRESNKVAAGEEASWVDGLVPVLDGPHAGADTVAGAQMFPGFAPQNANALVRNVSAFYVEAGHQVAKNIEATVSLRDEYFSDFGNTLNGKLLVHYDPHSALNLRASLSSGYRAPALQQIGYYRTSTSFNLRSNGVLTGLESGTFPVNNEVAQLLGAQPLNPEQSVRGNLGFTWRPASAWQFSADYFDIHIADRIILSGDINQYAKIPVAAKAYMEEHGISFARYFLNAVDTCSRGIDTSLTYSTRVNNHELSLNAQYHHHHTDIDSLRIPSQLNDLADSVFSRNEEERLLHYIPQDKALLSLTYNYNAWTLFAKANYFGKVLYVSSAANPASDQWFASRVTYDADVSFQYAATASVAVGVHNLLNTYPDYRASNPPLNGEGNILQFRGISPFDYTGAFYYVRTQIAF